MLAAIRSFLKDWDRMCCSWGDSCLGSVRRWCAQQENAAGSTPLDRGVRCQETPGSQNQHGLSEVLPLSSGFHHRALLAQAGGHHPTIPVWFQFMVLLGGDVREAGISLNPGVFCPPWTKWSFQLILYLLECCLHCLLWGLGCCLAADSLVRALTVSVLLPCFGYSPGSKEKTVLNSKRSKHQLGGF